MYRFSLPWTVTKHMYLYKDCVSELPSTNVTIGIYMNHVSLISLYNRFSPVVM